MINLPKLVLASGSPRRAEILTAVGWDFTKRVADIDESERDGESPNDYVVRLALEKAQAVATGVDGEIVLGADTTVVIDGLIIGKPLDENDAKRMIALLAGNWHEVLTGVAVIRDATIRTGIRSTRVKFASMSPEEIHFLAANGSPLDKAGAYAVQAQAALFIEAIEGDYWNVVGLPVSLVYELVMKTPGSKALGGS
jgi:septum formation protein